LLTSFKAMAQDPVFSQFYNAPLYLNPALIGDEDAMLFNLNYRSQWNSLHFPYTSAQTSFIYPFYSTIHKDPVDHIGGMGLSVFTDVAGTNQNFKTIGGNLSFAYNLNLSSVDINRITFGLQLGMINNRIDPDGLQWGQQYDPNIGHNPNEQPVEIGQFESSTVIDITPGVFWRFFNSNPLALINSAYSGLAVAHLNHPDVAVISDQEDKLPLLYKYHGGMVFAVTERANISANILSVFQDRENQTNFGAFFSYLLQQGVGEGFLNNAIVRIGGWHRFNDSFILSTEFVTNKLMLGFSYDWNATSLNRFESGIGAYELSMGLRFNRIAPPKVRY